MDQDAPVFDSKKNNSALDLADKVVYDAIIQKLKSSPIKYQKNLPLEKKKELSKMPLYCLAAVLKKKITLGLMFGFDSVKHHSLDLAQVSRVFKINLKSRSKYIQSDFIVLSIYEIIKRVTFGAKLRLMVQVFKRILYFEGWNPGSLKVISMTSALSGVYTNKIKSGFSALVQNHPEASLNYKIQLLKSKKQAKRLASGINSLRSICKTKLKQILQKIYKKIAYPLTIDQEYSLYYLYEILCSIQSLKKLSTIEIIKQYNP